MKTAPLKSAGAKDPVYKKNPAQDFTRMTLPSCTQSTQAKHEERIKQL